MSFTSSSLRRILPLGLALAGALGAGAVHAGGVHWSIGVHLPAPPVVVYQEPAPRGVYAPQPVYGAPVRYGREEHREWHPHRGHRHWHGHGHGHHHHHDRWEGERGARWERDHHGSRY